MSWQRNYVNPFAQKSIIRKIAYYAGIKSNLKADNNKQHLINHPFDMFVQLQHNTKQKTQITMFTKNVEYIIASFRSFRYPNSELATFYSVTGIFLF